MTKRTSFPAPWAARPRTPRPDTVRRALAALLAGVAAVVTVLVLAGAVSGWALLIAAAALLALPGARYGWGLMETVAPLPDVRGPRHALDGEIPDVMSVAVAAGVTRHVRVEGDETATTAIPQVQA